MWHHRLPRLVEADVPVHPQPEDADVDGPEKLQLGSHSAAGLSRVDCGVEGGEAIRGNRKRSQQSLLQVACRRARIGLAEPAPFVQCDDADGAKQLRIHLRASRQLEILEEIPYGGSLLAPLLYELVANFEEGNVEDETILRGLCAKERELIRAGKLSPDYAVVAARRRDL